MQEVGVRLGDWMRLNHITDGQVAAKVGCDRVSINRIRRGINPPSWPVMVAIYLFTKKEVTPSDFLHIAAKRQRA